jgi:hypothetical protein
VPTATRTPANPAGPATGGAPGLATGVAQVALNDPLFQGTPIPPEGYPGPGATFAVPPADNPTAGAPGAQPAYPGPGATPQAPAVRATSNAGGAFGLGGLGPTGASPRLTRAAADLRAAGSPPDSSAANDAQLSSQESSTLLLWTGFLLTLFIFMAALAGAIVLFTRPRSST